MNKVILILSIILLGLSFVGCGHLVPYYSKNFEIGKELTARTGSTLIYYESGIYNDKNLTRQPNGEIIELLYSGISGNTIFVINREYTDTKSGIILKDPFTYEVKYDLSKNNKIRFRSLQIEVIEATSEIIRYKVTEWDNLKHNSDNYTELPLNK